MATEQARYDPSCVIGMTKAEANKFLKDNYVADSFGDRKTYVSGTTNDNIMSDRIVVNTDWKGYIVSLR